MLTPARAALVLPRRGSAEAVAAESAVAVLIGLGIMAFPIGVRPRGD